jgi:hypothetical protein
LDVVLKKEEVYGKSLKKSAWGSLEILVEE